MTSPATPSDIGPAGPRRQQRGIQLPQLLLSLLVVAVFALLAVWWQASTTSRTPVLALAVDVEQGVPLSAADLQEIYISTDIPARVRQASDRDLFVGARPISDLSAGTLITGELFVGGAELAPGQAFVGLVLTGSKAPSGIVAGDRVQVLHAADDGAVEVLSFDARVESATAESGALRVRLRLDVVSAQQIQLMADQVVLIEVDNVGPASWEDGDDS